MTERDVIVRGSGVVALVAIPAVVLLEGAAGLAIFTLITIWVNGPLSPFLPAAYEPVLVYFGRLYPPLVVATIGTMASLYVEFINYRLHAAMLRTRAARRLTGGAMVQRVVRLFARSPAFTVWLCAWSPLPYWPVRILAPMAGLPVARHLVATALGRFPRLWLIAALGSVVRLDLKWLVGFTVLSSVVAGMVLLARRNTTDSTDSHGYHGKPRKNTETTETAETNVAIPESILWLFPWFSVVFRGIRVNPR